MDISLVLWHRPRAALVLQTSDLLNAAAMTQLAAAEEAELAARAALSQQVAGLEGLQAEKAALAQRMQDLQVSLSTRYSAVIPAVTAALDADCLPDSRHLPVLGHPQPT